MPWRAEQSRRLLGRAILLALLALAAIVSYLTLPAPWRPLGIKLVCTAIVIGGCAHARRIVRGALEGHPVSELDLPAPAPPAPDLDGAFRRIRDDLLFSLRSRQYFSAILWPRLHELTGGTVPMPAAGRRSRRGPTLPELEALIARAEERP